MGKHVTLTPTQITLSTCLFIKAGGVLGGRLSDYIVVKWMRKRKNEWVPEDRLRATLFSAGVLAPLSVVLAGVVTQCVKGTGGIVLTLVCFFVNGVGVSQIPVYRAFG